MVLQVSKTEIYMRAIEKVLALGQQAIVLVLKFH
jgi:primosomal protein N'